MATLTVQLGQAETKATEAHSSADALKAQLEGAKAEVITITHARKAADSSGDAAVREAVERAEAAEQAKKAAEASAEQRATSVQAVEAKLKAAVEELAAAKERGTKAAAEHASVQAILDGSRKASEETAAHLVKAREEAEQLRASLATKTKDAKAHAAKARKEADKLRATIDGHASKSKTNVGKARKEADKKRDALEAQAKEMKASVLKSKEEAKLLRSELDAKTAEMTKAAADVVLLQQAVKDAKSGSNQPSKLQQPSSGANNPPRDGPTSSDMSVSATQVASANAETAVYQQRVTELEAEMEEARATAAQTAAVLAKERARATERIYEMSDIVNELADLKKQHVVVQDGAKSAAASSAALVSAANSAAASSASAVQIDQLQAKVSELEEDALDKAEMLRHAEHNLLQAQVDIDEAIDLQTESFELQAQCTQIKASLEIEQNENTRLHNLLVAAENDVEMLQSNVARFETAMAAMDAVPSNAMARQRLVRQLIRDKAELEGTVAKLNSEIETARTLAGEAAQEMEDGGRVVELENELAELQDQLEKSTGKKTSKRLRGVMPLVNVRALQSERDRLEEFSNQLKVERDALAKKVQGNQEKVDYLEDELFSLKDRLKLKGGEGKTAPKTKKEKARMFCHVCEVFEKHDTLDCPYNKSAPRKVATKVSLDRAYCEVCETFGHSTDDCNVGLDDEDDADDGAGAGAGDDDDFY